MAPIDHFAGMALLALGLAALVYLGLEIWRLVVG
jgi:hypothetical protein